MKKNSIKEIKLFFVLGFLVFILFPIISFADDGGVVQTKGDITFFEEEPSSSSSAEPSTTEPSQTTPADSVSTIKKPKGKLPSTGELVKASLSISGILLIVVASGLFFWKKRKDIIKYNGGE
ncbi:LPXTG cell wall anchor domain-containing protein [Enterococcus rotai]|uniref:LPXTG cell wall anchor domain-containing protein n=1 Tax=Enterococcus rotai TaxID=118060 RepID=UPI0032B459A8